MYFMVSVGILTLFAGESAAQNRYFPLAVGNRWLYELNAQDPLMGAPGEVSPEQLRYWQLAIRG